MPKKKGLPALLLAAVMLLCTLPASAQYTPPFEVRSDAVLLINMDTGRVMYEKNADKPLPPASLTKIMTAILALENIEDLDNTYIPLKLYIQDTLYGTNATLGGIYQGEEVTARGLIYAAMLQSANEAAMMLGDYMGDGSLTQFYEMMNEKARELGCSGETVFTSSNGMVMGSDGADNMSTARDLAKIAAYAMENPEFVEIVNTPSYNIGPTYRNGAVYQENLWENTTNKMINPSSEYFYPGASGIKTGSLDNYRCLITTASKDGFNYMLVILGAPYDTTDADTRAATINVVFDEATSLFNWAFNSFTVKTLLDKGSYISDIPVELSFDRDVVGLMSSQRFTALVPNDIEASSIQLIPEIPDSINAPVEKGQEIGQVKIMLAGEELGSVPLVANETIEMSNVLFYWSKVKTFLDSFWFKFALIFLLLLLVFYIALMVLRNRRYGKRARRRPVNKAKKRPRRRL